MKKNFILLTIIALATSFHIHSGPKPNESAPGRTKSLNLQENTATVSQIEGTGEIAAHFKILQPEPNKPIPVQQLGEITGLTISDKTSSSTIAANISKQLTKPLSASEQSLLQKALDEGRTSKNWENFNAQLKAILKSRASSHAGEEMFSENNLLNALVAAEKTNSLTDIYNKTKSFFGSIKNTLSKPEVPKSSGAVITFSESDINTQYTQKFKNQRKQEIQQTVNETPENNKTSQNSAFRIEKPTQPSTTNQNQNTANSIREKRTPNDQIKLLKFPNGKIYKGYIDANGNLVEVQYVNDTQRQERIFNDTTKIFDPWKDTAKPANKPIPIPSLKPAQNTANPERYNASSFNPL